MPRTPKPPGTSTPSTPGERLADALGRLALRRRDPADLDLGVVGEAAGAQGLVTDR
jgi:hypothetical protein